MQVFISYAHTAHDSRIARWLVANLRLCGLSPWLDETDTSPGDLIEGAIRQAIDRSHAAIFLISRSWLERSWTSWELGQFAMRQPPCERLVPVLCGSAADLQRLVPPHLTQRRHIEWPTDDAEILPVYWNIYCGVLGRKPGPREDWKVQAEALIGARGAPLPRSEPPRPMWDPGGARLHPGQQRVSLRCNRVEHWGLVETHAQDPRHEVLLVPGTRGQGHEHFLVRIEGELRRDPPRYMKILSWPRRPVNQDGYLEVLASNLELEAGPRVNLRARLVRRLQTLMAHQNLILLQPPIRADFLDPEILAYYTETLPALLTDVRPAFHLKCVQAIEWRRSNPFRRGAARLMRLMWGAAEASWIEEASEERDAGELITRLARRASRLVPIVALPRLEDVPDHDVIEFFSRLGVPDAQKRRLLARVRSNSHTPEELFRAIDEYYPEFAGAR